MEQLTQQLAQWQTKFEEQEEMVRLLTEALSAKNNSQAAPSSRNPFLQPQRFDPLPGLKEQGKALMMETLAFQNKGKQREVPPPGPTRFEVAKPLSPRRER